MVTPDPALPDEAPESGALLEKFADSVTSEERLPPPERPVPAITCREVGT
jgi:hypothetical protein